MYVYVCLYALCAQVPTEARRGYQTLGSEAISSPKHSGSLEEQSVITLGCCSISLTCNPRSLNVNFVNSNAVL